MFQRIIKQLLPSNHREAQFNRLMSATEPCSKTLINSSADAEFRNLLFCLDRSQYAENTLPYIVALAKGWNARITLLHVLEANKNPHNDKPTDLFDWKIRRNEAQEYLRKIAEGSHCKQMEIAYALQEGQVIEQIGAWGMSHSADLTVFAKHNDQSAACSSLGSTALKILQVVPASLLLIPAAAQAMDPQTAPLSRILLPLDGSAQAETAFPVALRLAEIHQAELVLVHIVTTPQLVKIGTLCSNDTALEQRLSKRNEITAKAYLDACLVKIDTNKISVRTRLINTGDARDVLPKIAQEENTDLVVLSAHGVSGRLKEPCGSVTAHLLAYLDAPLLVVRERTKQAHIIHKMHQDETRIPLRASA